MGHKHIYIINSILNMSPRLLYKLKIENPFTKEVSLYELNGPVTNVVEKVNLHFGCKFITTAGLNNIISRPNITAERFKGITITRFQLDTKKYKDGLGSRYEPLKMPETIREETIVQIV